LPVSANHLWTDGRTDGHYPQCGLIARAHKAVLVSLRI